MEKETSFFDIFFDIFVVVGTTTTIVLFVMLVVGISGFETDVKAKVGGVPLESIEYRGAKLYWESGNPMPEHRLEIFYKVMDSLADDVTKEYSLGRNPTDFFYLTAHSYYWGDLTGGNCFDAAAFQRGTEVFLSPVLVDSNNNDVFFSLEQFRYGPWQRFDDNQACDDGYFAMVIIHEYVHVVQFNHSEYLNSYASDVGWQGDNKPEEDENFYSVLSSYSLENPSEDMSETFMYSYLCGNNLEGLSETRLQYIDDFWGVPREQYCQDFH
jgi:hypothetical protein